jgi:hypothetical protein
MGSLQGYSVEEPTSFGTLEPSREKGKLEEYVLTTSIEPNDACSIEKYRSSRHILDPRHRDLQPGQSSIHDSAMLTSAETLMARLKLKPRHVSDM